MKDSAIRTTSRSEIIKLKMIPIALTILLGAVATYIYFTVLMQTYDRIAIERSYWGTWGFGGYILILSLLGFLMSLKSSHILSLLCSIGIPLLFIIVIFFAVANTSPELKIPQYSTPTQQFPTPMYNEMVHFGIYIWLVSLVAGGVVFCSAFGACLVKRAKTDKIPGRIKA